MEDVEYAETDAAGQLALGVPGEQRAIPGLGKPSLDDLIQDGDVEAVEAAIVEAMDGQGTLDD